MSKVYIITGANGFLGNNLVRQILATDPTAEIRALVSSLDHANALTGLDCRIFAGDVTKPDTLQEIFNISDCQELYVLHCAAIVYIKSKPNPAVFNVNVGGTKNIAELTLEHNGKLIYVNSVHALTEKPDHAAITEQSHFYPDQVEGQYAQSKAEAANLILDLVNNRGLNACIVQPSGIIGPYDYRISHLTQLIIDFATRRLKAAVRGGYDFVDVRDVAQGIINACTKGQPGESYILSGHYTSVQDLLNLVSDAYDISHLKSILPMWLAKLTAPLSEIYYNIKKQPPLYTKYSLYTLESNSNFSHAKADRDLDYHARPLSKTINDTVKWLEQSGKIPNKSQATETTKS